MAKRRKTDGDSGEAAGERGEYPGGQPTGNVSKIEDFAEDLGRLLGTAQAKAQGWLGQRQNVAKQLEQIRDTAHPPDAAGRHYPPARPTARAAGAA